MGQAPADKVNTSRQTATAVEVLVGNKRFWALVDTGADFSMIRDGLQGRLHSDLGCRLSSPSQGARGAGGEPLQIKGILHDVPLLIQDKPFSCDSMAVVGGLIYDVVLGRDFCCRYGTIIDDQQGTLTLDGLTIRLPYYSDLQPTRARVLLGATTVVPPRSASIVEATIVPVDGIITNTFSTPLEGVIEPSMTGNREELLIPREVVVVKENRTVPVRLTNLGGEEVRILRGSDVGTFHTINSARLDNEYELCEDEGKRADGLAAVC